jgi:MFS family permease
LQSRPCALLWGGQTISALGDGAYTPALSWQTLLLTHSSAALAAIVTATIAPRLIFLLIGGLVADRLPRRTVLFCADTGRALAVGAIAALSWTNTLALWHLVALGASFVVSAVSLLAIRMPRRTEFAPVPDTTGDTADETGEPAGKSIQARQRSGGIRLAGRELREAAIFILGSIWLLTTMVIPAFGNAAFGGAMLVTLPRLFSDVYGADVLASLALLSLALPFPWGYRAPVALIAGAIYGLGGETFQTIWVTLLHELTPNKILGRVASIDLLGSFCLQPLGFSRSGPGGRFTGSGMGFSRRGNHQPGPLYLSALSARDPGSQLTDACGLAPSCDLIERHDNL